MSSPRRSYLRSGSAEYSNVRDLPNFKTPAASVIASVTAGAVASSSTVVAAVKGCSGASSATCGPAALKDS